MEFAISSEQVKSQKSACLVVPVFKTNTLGRAAQEVDQASSGKVSQVVSSGDLDGSAGKTLLLHFVDGINAERVLLVGCGDKDKFAGFEFARAVSASVAALKQHRIEEAVCYLADEQINQRDQKWAVKTGTQLVEEALFRTGAQKTRHDPPPARMTRYTWGLGSIQEDQNTLETAIAQGHAIGLGSNFARDLGDFPGNICTPAYLADQAKAMEKEFKKLSVEVLEESDMEKLGMGALLSVSKGSRQPAKLIIFQYNGGKKDVKPVALVGKGLTFDAGGISLKPAEAMDEMKYDMCGAASVFGTIKAIALMDLAINVIGIVPSSENLPDGEANKPGDIVTSMSGQTIEILNTDAEGRLILCDALTYTERFEPSTVIDIATLTGACVIALGAHASGLFSENDHLASEILEAGTQSLDRAWRMPLWEDYQEQLKSNFADMANVGGRPAGSITAACFLSKFTSKFDWAHLDIAGTAWISGAKKGATGRPVPLLSQLLINRSQNG